LLLAGARLWAADTAPTPPHSGWTTDDIVTLRDQMHKMEDSFAELDGYLSRKPPAYADILATLDRVEGIAKMIQKVNGNPKLTPSFKRLLRDIKDFRAEAKARHSSGMENGMNSLFENCFGCHLTHSAARPARALPAAKP